MSTAAGSLARFGLIALLVLALGALLLSSASPAGAQSGSGTVDYDTDGDNLIEVSTLDQLNAIRYDLDGNGTVASGDQANYDIAFPNALASMGCAATCTGYELEADLDFNTDTGSDSGGAAVIDAADDYHNSGAGWEPLGDSGPNPFRTTFDGNNHTISNLFINVAGSSDNYIGLFGQLGGGSVRRVHLVDANVTGNNDVGALVGHISRGTVSHSSSSGTVSGVGKVGGLVGTIYSSDAGPVEYSRSSATVTGTGSSVGGLAGTGLGAVRASYATGAVTGAGSVGGLMGYIGGSIYASYATGAVSAIAGSNASVGGLVGGTEGIIRASYSTGAVTSASGDAKGLVNSNFYSESYAGSYWDVTTTGIPDDSDDATGEGKTTIELQSPTQTDGYAGIYANWNLDLDSDSNADDPWDFGTASQYPALKADSDGDGRATAYEFGRQGRSAPVVDYDVDGDNLIEVSTLAQLNAIRHDLDGNGDSTHAVYTGAFSNAASGMGCAATCLGYELTADLDFDTNGSGTANLGDTYWNTGSGWAPIGSDSSASTRYNAVFDGDGHTISNLFISRNSTGDGGLFGSSSATSAIRNVGLESANVTGQNYTGALIGSAFGAVDFAYSTGSVTGRDHVGGLVGYFEGEIQRSYSTASVTGWDYVGGLVGNTTSTAVIKASYATGAVSGRIGVGGLVGRSDGDITANYSTGAVTGTGSNVGGLVGDLVGNSGKTITNSYWDVTTSTQADDSVAATGEGKTTSDLQSPTQTNGYAGIYANWNLNLDSTAGGDDPWDFGTASQYPALKADFNRDGVKSAVDGDFGRQPRAAPVVQPPVVQPPVVAPGTVDYDTDDNGLIEVDSLDKLNAIRWDLDGNGASANAGYATAFPTPEASMGCLNNTCTGYELTADLDFNTDTGSDSGGVAVIDSDDDYHNSGAGWVPIGDGLSASLRYNAIFDGGGHTISNLFINRTGTYDVGLFGATGTSGKIRNVGLEGANVTGSRLGNTGALIGTAYGTVDAAYSTGSVTGTNQVGGLVGYMFGSGSIQRSYSTASVTASGDNAGGLVALSAVGSGRGIRGSYATGAVSGASYVGGLVGHSSQNIIASYARGAVNGTGSNVGGLVGIRSARTITNSYWDVTTSGIADDGDAATGEGKTTSDLATPQAYGSGSAIYANWNLDLDSTAGGDDPWDFGTASQYPAIKADFNRDGVKSAVDGDFGRQPRSAANAPPTFANAPPTFATDADTDPSVAEGTKAVGSYAASDPDGDALTYGKSGVNAGLFSISGAGALSLISAADHEKKESYRVTLHVRDSKDADGHADAAWDDEIDLIVGVDDDETEAPGAPTGLTANPIAEGLQVSWTAPVRTDQPPVTGYGVEYKLGTATAWTSHSHAGTGTTTQITGLTSGATYNVRVRALSHENPSGWTSAGGVPAAAGQTADYDTDDDGLIEIEYLDQLNAMRWDADGDGAGGGPDYDAAFPDAAPGMGCPSGCTGYELEADLNFDTNGRVGADSGDDYWNGGMGWAPFWYYGTFEGNRHTISNLYVNRPDSDHIGLFSTAGAYAEVGEVRNLGLENVDVTGREYVGGLAGRAHASVRRVYTTGEVMGKKMVGGLVGEARNLISETYSKADVTGDGWESSNVGGLVGYLRLGTVKASYATGDVSGMTWVGGLVGHNSSSDDGGVIAGYATGNLGFGGLEDSNAVPGRWVDGFSSRYYLPYTPTWVGGLVGDSSGPVVASYSTGGHPISLAGFQPGERKDRSRRDLAYMMEVHWKIGGLVGKSYGRQERDSYWDTVTSRHRPGDDPKWVYGEGKTTEELRSVTGYTGIYADWNVDLDGDGIGDDPWDFGSGAHYPTLKVDFNGDGTATAYEFGGQGRSLNDDVPLVGNTGVFEVAVPENTPSGAPIFGVTLPLAPAAASSYRMFHHAEWPDTAHFRLNAATGQLFTRGALDFESKDTYRLRITASGTGGARPSNGIIIRVTDVAEPPGAPTGVTIVPLKGSLVVSWTPPDMAGKPPLRIYEVTYYHDGDKAKITAADTTTYTMTHLTPLITYAVRVRARNVDGWGPDSAVALGTPYWHMPSASATGAEPGTRLFRRSATPPGQPANLRATPQTDGSALVTWDAPAEAGDDAFYRVRRRVDAADSSYQVIARRVEAAGSDGVVAYRDEGNGRQAGQRHLYSARAFDGDGKPLGRWTSGVRDNRPPAFAEDSAAAFTVAENTAAGAAIGDPATATDPDDGDTLTYLLDGADADHFAIDADSGQLQTSGALDYESQDSYAVTVIAADGAGLWAGLDATITVTDVADTTPGKPDAPEIINVRQKSFRITWTAPSEGSSAITGYGIQYKLSSEADSAYADAKPTKRGTLTGYNLVNRRGQSVVKGTSYDVRVRARSAEGWGEWSDAATAVTASPAPAIVATPTPPPTPGQLAAPTFVNVQQTFFRITWTAPAAGSSAITGYGIQYKLSSEEDTAYAAVKPTPTGTVTGYNLVNRRGQSVVKGTSYDVRVRAKNAAGWGPWSAPATAVTASPAPPANNPPGQPDAPEISNVKETSFRVTWTAPSAGSSAITGYGIQYKLSSGADSAYAGAKPTKRGTVTGYNLVNRNGQSITAGTSYDVRVRARSAEGWGEWSDAATAVTASPDPPANGDEA